MYKCAFIRVPITALVQILYNTLRARQAILRIVYIYRIITYTNYLLKGEQKKRNGLWKRPLLKSLQPYIILKN